MLLLVVDYRQVPNAQMQNDQERHGVGDRRMEEAGDGGAVKAGVGGGECKEEGEEGGMKLPPASDATLATAHGDEQDRPTTDMGGR
eukprot:scaffold564_cov248-Pinguiococcus_pyrenoidosus.AAC.27